METTLEPKTKVRESTSPQLTCVITGTTRPTNEKYLRSKAEKKGITVNDFVQYYAGKQAVKRLRAGQSYIASAAGDNGNPAVQFVFFEVHGIFLFQFTRFSQQRSSLPTFRTTMLTAIARRTIICGQSPWLQKTMGRTWPDGDQTQEGDNGQSRTFSTVSQIQPT